jgi:hypothetical protein
LALTPPLTGDPWIDDGAAAWVAAYDIATPVERLSIVRAQLARVLARVSDRDRPTGSPAPYLKLAKWLQRVLNALPAEALGG